MFGDTQPFLETLFRLLLKPIYILFQDMQLVHLPIHEYVYTPSSDISYGFSITSWTPLHKGDTVPSRLKTIFLFRADHLVNKIQKKEKTLLQLLCVVCEFELIKANGSVSKKVLWYCKYIVVLIHRIWLETRHREGTMVGNHIPVPHVQQVLGVVHDLVRLCHRIYIHRLKN